MESDQPLICPLCGGPIDPAAVIGVCGTIATEYDPVSEVGGIAYVDVCGVAVPAVPAAPGSPIAREGFQVAILLCDDDCAKALRLAIALDDLLNGREPRICAAGVFGLRLLDPFVDVASRVRPALLFLLSWLEELAPEHGHRIEAARFAGERVHGRPRATIH